MINKLKKVFGEFKSGALHSGSKNGPEVKSRPQAIAIALSEARKAGQDIAPPPISPYQSVLKKLKLK